MTVTDVPWWEDLCNSGDDDDEDYDPFKDAAARDSEAQQDSDSDSFEGLRLLLSPKTRRKRTSERARVEGEQSTRASTDDSPLAQPHWHTRKQGKLPDDVWTQTECLLEKAEMALEPFSPGAQSDTCENEMLANCTNPEYLRLLAVARGEREPDEEDEEDADFVPEFEDEDGQGARENNDNLSGAKLSVSTAELSALIADNQDSAAVHASHALSVKNSPSKKGRPNESDKGKETAEEEIHKPSRSRRVRHNKNKKTDSCVVRVLPFADGSGLLPFPGSTAGFSRDQCIQLQGQMREYLQLATQQYVLNCCSPEKDQPQKADDIRQLHAGISEMYQLWEVSREYCLMQTKAMQALTEFIVGRAPGGESTVQVLEENRFTFFDTPGISSIPALLEAVADECSHVSEAGGDSACSRRAEGSEEEGGEGEQLSRDSAIARRSFQQANGILDMFEEHFDQALKLLPPSAIAKEGGGVAAAAGAGQFTRAEDALLLNGLKRFGCDESSWERIRVHVLPTKRSLDIKARYKRLISRHEEDNDVKTWKLSLAEGLSQEETELLQKGVQYFGTRFDLIAEKVMKNRSETELRQAYTKLLSKLARTSKPATRAASSAMPSGCQGVLASSAVTAEDSTGGDSRVERGATGGGVGDGSKRRGAAKKKGFHSDLLADRSPDVNKRRRLQSAGVRSLYQLPEDEDADEDDFEHEDLHSSDDEVHGGLPRFDVIHKDTGAALDLQQSSAATPCVMDIRNRHSAREAAGTNEASTSNTSNLRAIASASTSRGRVGSGGERRAVGVPAGDLPEIRNGSEEVHSTGKQLSFSLAQDKCIFEAGRSAADSQEPHSYEETWHKLCSENREGLGICEGKQLSDRFDYLIRAYNSRLSKS